MAWAFILMMSLLILEQAGSRRVNFTLEDQELGMNDDEGKSICLFFGPIASGDDLFVNLTVTANRPISLGLSQRHECPAKHPIACDVVKSAQSDKKGVLKFHGDCNVEPGSWIILSTVDLSVQSQVTGLISVDHMDSPTEVFTFRDEPLGGGQCLSYGPTGKQSQLHIELTTDRMVPLEIRVEEEKLCPPKDYTFCGLDKFQMMPDGLTIHTDCDIQAGSWITLYYANKTDNTTVTGMIYFRRLWRDLNSAIILGSICAAVFLVILGVSIFFSCYFCKKARDKQNTKGEFMSEEVGTLRSGDL